MIIEKCLLRLSDVYKRLKACRDNQVPITGDYIFSACYYNANPNNFFDILDNHKYLINMLFEIPIDSESATGALLFSFVLARMEVVEYLMSMGGKLSRKELLLTIKTCKGYRDRVKKGPKYKHAVKIIRFLQDKVTNMDTKLINYYEGNRKTV